MHYASQFLLFLNFGVNFQNYLLVFICIFFQIYKIIYFECLCMEQMKSYYPPFSLSLLIHIVSVFFLKWVCTLFSPFKSSFHRMFFLHWPNTTYFFHGFVQMPDKQNKGQNIYSSQSLKGSEYIRETVIATGMSCRCGSRYIKD